MDNCQVFKLIPEEFGVDGSTNIQSIYTVITNELAKNFDNRFSVELQLVATVATFSTGEIKVMISDGCKKEYSKDDIIGLIYDHYEAI